MKNVIGTLSAAVIAVGLTLGASACGGDPCAALIDKVCDGDKDCIAEAQQAKDQPPKGACEAMLKDDKMIEGMKAARKAEKAAKAAATSDPCATLLDKVCDGDKDCIAEAKNNMGQPPKEACKAMLKDDKNIETLRAAMKAKKEAASAAKSDPCATLLDKICDGDKDCIAEAKEDENQPPKESCEALLKDDKNVETLKAAMKAKKAAEASATKAAEAAE